jgi:uncharacterized protein DUF4255
VLHEADESLGCWLAEAVPGGTRVSFDTPHPGWAAAPPASPLLDAFLCHVGEDSDGRLAGWAPVRDTDGRTIGREQPPRRYVLCYLVTAWTTGPAQACHELLGALLTACAGLDALPPGCLRGSLAAAGLPVLLRCPPAVADTGHTRWWAGFGLPPKTLLELHLVVPVVPPGVAVAAPAREVSVGLAATGTGTSPQPPAARRVGRTAGGPGRRSERARISEHGEPGHER